jgi:Transposase, Mutator family
LPVGAPAHTFTEALPRQVAGHADCVECERSVAAHEGRQAPRCYRFPAREIARTLVALGQGQTYRKAAERARGRLAGGGESRHGQLAADWVEVFAPVVFAPHAPTSWPDHGTLVLDHFYFRLRRSDTPTRSYYAWHVLCALAYVDGQRELWRLQAFTNATPASWREFFSGLPGAPARIVCDAHSGMLKVIEERWPQTEVYLCEWHLRHALERLLEKIGGSTAEALLPRTEAAFAGRHFWARFDVEARQLDDDRMNAWLDRWSPIITAQLSRRHRGANDAGDQPRSTGGLETFIKPIQAAFYRRRYGMKNQERLNRLLLLLQLEANGHADERMYAKDIRDWLELTGGRPATPRRAIADSTARPSLRDPGARLAPARTRRHTRTSDEITPATWGRPGPITG